MKDVISIVFGLVWFLVDFNINFNIYGNKYLFSLICFLSLNVFNIFIIYSWETYEACFKLVGLINSHSGIFL